MRVLIPFLGVIVAIIFLLSASLNVNKTNSTQDSVVSESKYWLVLERKADIEHLYFGLPGDSNQSIRIKTFKVKSGVPGMKPTPLPSKLGRDYWLIVDRLDTSTNPETAPYFLTLDVPVTDEWPYGPVPYEECEGQCDWEIPGYFGLHGVNGNLEKLSNDDMGSSGCVRHSDQDITFLYNLIDPAKEPVRYYVSDD